MRYLLSVAWHFLSGKLTLRHAIYALRVRPVAVISKGRPGWWNRGSRWADKRPAGDVEHPAARFAGPLSSKENLMQAGTPTLSVARYLPMSLVEIIDPAVLPHARLTPPRPRFHFRR